MRLVLHLWPHRDTGCTPAEAVDEARWWERHIVEVLTGVSPDAEDGTVPRPEYDPGTVTLTRREQAKAAELTAAGHPVTASAVAKRRRRYQQQGLAGMADYRARMRMPPHGRADAAVAAAMRQASAWTGCRHQPPLIRAILLRKAADQAGLTAWLSGALRKAGQSPVLDRGVVLVSMAAAIAPGATSMSDIAVLAHLAPVLGDALSGPTVRRALDLAGTAAMLERGS